MIRMAMKDVTLPDKTILRKGQRCAIDESLMFNPDFYKNPNEFDGYRFFRMREDPDLNQQAHLVSTSPAHLGFGHGISSCPGRFFASITLKVALTHLLINYDWKLAPKCTPKQGEFGFYLTTDHSAKVLLRRRENPELDLSKI